MRSFANRFGLAVLLTWGPVLVTAAPAGAATWCVPDSAQQAYEAVLIAAPDSSAFETEARQIADQAEAAGQFDTPETLTRLDDLAYDNGYLYDCDTDAYAYAPAETGYQVPTSSTTTTTRPAPTTTTTRPTPTTTTTRATPATTGTTGTTVASGTPAVTPPAPPPPPSVPTGSATPPAPEGGTGTGTGTVTPFSDEAPLSVFPSGGIRPESGGADLSSAPGSGPAGGSAAAIRRESVDRGLFPAPVAMAAKALALTILLCAAGLAVAVAVNRRRLPAGS